MLKATPIPDLSTWSRDELTAAITHKVKFVVPSGLGGSFDVNMLSFDYDAGTGRFRVNMPNAGDFHGTERIEDLVAVNRILGSWPDWLRDHAKD